MPKTPRINRWIHIWRGKQHVTKVRPFHHPAVSIEWLRGFGWANVQCMKMSNGDWQANRNGKSLKNKVNVGKFVYLRGRKWKTKEIFCIESCCALFVFSFCWGRMFTNACHVRFATAESVISDNVQLQLSSFLSHCKRRCQTPFPVSESVISWFQNSRKPPFVFAGKELGMTSESSHSSEMWISI